MASSASGEILTDFFVLFVLVLPKSNPKTDKEVVVDVLVVDVRPAAGAKPTVESKVAEKRRAAVAVVVDFMIRAFYY